MLTLSPAEALGTYNGFVLAGVLQQGILYWIPTVLILANLIKIATAVSNSRDIGLRDGTRFIMALMVLFFVWTPNTQLNPGTFQSAAAIADGAPIQSAAQMPADARITGTPPEIGGLSLTLVEIISESWLNIAIAMRQQALRPFSGTQPLAWLVTQGIETESIGAVRDWTSLCVVPAWSEVLGSSTNMSFAQMLPFSGSATYDAMGGITVRPGRGYSYFTRWSSVAGNTVSCQAYGDRILSQVEGQLDSTLTASGRPITEVWAEEDLATTTEAAEFLIMKNVYEAASLAPPPSMRSIYLAASAVGVVDDAASGAATGAMRGPIGAVVGAGAGAIVGSLRNLAGAVLRWVGPALMITEFASDFLGLGQTIVIMMMPVMYMYILVPGRQAILTPVMSYFVVLSMFYSGPVWWAGIELLQASAGDSGANIMIEPSVWGKEKIAPLIYQVFGVGFMIAVMTSVTALAAGLSGVSFVQSLRRA